MNPSACPGIPTATWWRTPLVDALLASAGLGDIGSNFGTDRPEWKGASGVAFLIETAGLLRAAGIGIGNVSVQVIGNRPRMAARRGEAERVLSGAIGGPRLRLRHHHGRARPHRAG